jgi:hypothetical protein
MIRKVQMLGLLVVLASALSGLVTASASAALTYELALWLLNTADITSPILVDSEGELFLENLLNLASILCSGLFEGVVEGEGLDQVTMVYDLASPQNLIEELVSTPILCTSDNECAANTAQIWPINLPWLTEVKKDVESGLFYDITLANGNGAPGYHLECTVLGIKAEELCVAPAANPEFTGEILNVTGGVEGMGVVEPEAECNNNANEGLLEFVGGNITQPIGGGTLTVSAP